MRASSEIHRRQFLVAAGMTPLALALMPATAWAGVGAGKPGQVNFHFLAISDAMLIDGVHHRMLMAGHGGVTPGAVVGNGSFQHQNAIGSVPQQILGEGSWKAKKLVSFDKLGSHGAVGVAGTLVMEIDLIPVTGPKISAELEVVCNIPPAGLFTGKPEGYKLTVPGAPFGPFVPLGPPPLGITWFTTGVEQDG